VGSFSRALPLPFLSFPFGENFATFKISVIAVLTKQEMIMVWHQTVSDERNRILFDILAKLAQKVQVILPIMKHRCLTMATIVNVIDVAVEKFHVSVHRFLLLGDGAKVDLGSGILLN
jgi:hypothetical protein